MFAGQSRIHALANDLDEEGFWSRMRIDPNSRVTAVRSFCIAFAFISGEAEEDYSRALGRLRSFYETCKARQWSGDASQPFSANDQAAAAEAALYSTSTSDQWNEFYHFGTL